VLIVTGWIASPIGIPIDSTSGGYSRSPRSGEAVTDATNQWPTLGVYLTAGRLTIDNGPTDLLPDAWAHSRRAGGRGLIIPRPTSTFPPVGNSPECPSYASPMDRRLCPARPRLPVRVPRGLTWLLAGLLAVGPLTPALGTPPTPVDPMTSDGSGDGDAREAEPASILPARRDATRITAVVPAPVLAGTFRRFATITSLPRHVASAGNPLGPHLRC
jgi:hypothetical protein